METDSNVKLADSNNSWQNNEVTDSRENIRESQHDSLENIKEINRSETLNNWISLCEATGIFIKAKLDFNYFWNHGIWRLYRA